MNADDPEACIAAVRLGMMYREKFRHDCVIDLVGYRRHGHNEGDEPRYTQPVMYQRIDRHPTVRDLYATALVRDGVLTQAAADEMDQRQYDLLVRTQQALRDDLRDEGAEPVRISGQ